MSSESFKPNNDLQKRFEGKMAGGGEGEGFLELSDDEEEEKKKKRLEEMENTKEKKEAAFDFVNERINLEITAILRERGVEDLDTEGYAKVRQEAVLRAIEKMKQENPEFSATVDEAEEIAEEESNKLISTLEKSGASEEVIDESRRGFLKMLGLGAMVAVAGMAVPKSAEAMNLNQYDQSYKDSHESAILIDELEKSATAMTVLSKLTDKDINDINDGTKFLSLDNALVDVINNKIVIGLSSVGMVAGGILGAHVGAAQEDEPGKATISGAVVGGILGMLAAPSARYGWKTIYPDDPRIEILFLEKNKGNIDRALIWKEIQRLQDRESKIFERLGEMGQSK